MALIKCPECGHEVSDKASSCPNCGCPMISVEKAKVNVVNTPVSDKEKLIINKFSKTNVTARWIGFIITILLTIAAISIEIASSKIGLFILGACLLICAFISLMVSISFCKKVRVLHENHNNLQLLVLVSGSRMEAYCDCNPIQIVVIKHNGNQASDYILILPNGEKAKMLFSGSVILLEYINSQTTIGSQTIVNNVVNNIVKSNKKTERSDMEKILIKNAKVDALASIDPTNTEKSKEQIKIVKELDDLD